MSTTTEQVIEEDIGGDSGFHLKFTVRHNEDGTAYNVSVTAWEVVAAQGHKVFYRAIDDPLRTLTEAPTQDMAEPYLEGNVGWDGCCNFLFDQNGNYNHFCGPRDLIKHFALLKHIYVRACELGNFTEEPWPSNGKATR